MYQVTWIYGGTRLFTVSTPSRMAAQMMYAAMRRQFRAVRLWYKKEMLA